MAQFKLAQWNVSTERTGDPADEAHVYFTFYVQGPEGNHSATLTLIWPSGNSVNIETPAMLPFDPIGPTQIQIPVTLENIRSGAYAFRLSIAGEEVGTFPFAID